MKQRKKKMPVDYCDVQDIIKEMRESGGFSNNTDDELDENGRLVIVNDKEDVDLSLIFF